MPAESYAVAIPVGDHYRRERAEQNSGNRNPTSYGNMRGSLAAQGNRIDDTSLIRRVGTVSSVSLSDVDNLSLLFVINNILASFLEM